MANTPFSNTNKKFTDDCHLLAQKILYPKFFGVEPDKIIHETTDLNDGAINTYLDGNMGIDRKPKVYSEMLLDYVEHTVQERFRRPEYHRFQDITITSWNFASNTKSEIYKMSSEYFVYGYANDDNDPTDFIEAYFIDATKVKTLIVNNGIPYIKRYNKRTQQDFFCVTISELNNHDCILDKYKNGHRQDHLPNF